MTRDPRIDDYIARQAAFAQPILEHLRAAVHAACPQATETIKWGMPHFLYKDAMLAGMGAFKAHVTFGFWRGKEIVGEEAAEGAMGQFGRIAAIDDLPAPEIFAGLVHKAMALTDGGAARPRAKKPPKPAPVTPDDLAAALEEVPAARATFDAFAPSCRREYVNWVVEAKRPETRAKRIAEAVQWMAEGKRRNWKYEGC
jgi:uncharacterized protein YdeI (YjbR/CyaY-like superfamily)